MTVPNKAETSGGTTSMAGRTLCTAKETHCNRERSTVKEHGLPLSFQFPRKGRLLCVPNLWLKNVPNMANRRRNIASIDFDALLESMQITEHVCMLAWHARQHCAETH